MCQMRIPCWKSAETDKPPHAKKVIVEHQTSYGKDHAFGQYWSDEEKWHYFPSRGLGPIEVTHWTEDIPFAE